MKKKIIFLSIFIFVLLVGGVGIYFYTQTHRDPITWADESKYKTYTEPAPTDGSLPTDYDSYMNMAYMLWTLEHAENFSSTTRGTAVSVGQTQEILNRRIVNKDKQVVETYSGGLITLGKQKYFINNRVLLRDYATKNGETFTWKMDEPECITEDTYKQRYGWFPTQSTAYIICNETILEISDIKVLDNGLYSISLSLNPGENFAPFWYAREVWTNASSLSKPAFSSIELEYTFDANWRVHKVNTKEKYKVTPKVAPLLVDCVTNIEEIFDYENYKIEDSTILFFDQYKDMQPADGEIPSEPDSPLSYITGALLSSKEEKKFDLTIDVNGNKISGQMALNLSDLNQIGVKVRFGNFQVVYQKDTVYIDFGTNKIKLNQKEFMELLAPILEDTTTTDSADISSIFDINEIMSEISTAQITKENDLVTIDMVLHLLGLELPIQFKIKESGQDMDLISISASIKCNDVQADVILSANPNATFLDVTGEYNDTKNLKFIVDDIIKIIKNKELGINFNFKWNDFDITMNAFLNWNSKLAVQADFILKKLDIEESFRITYFNEVIYLDYHNIKIKLTIEQAKEMIDSNLTLPEDLDANVNINEILSTLMTLNFDNILKYISINENEVLFGLDLSMFIKDLNQIDVKITDSENGFDFINESYGIQISILSQIDHMIEVEDSEYSSIKEYSKVIEYIISLVNKESIRMDIEGRIEKYNLGIKGQIDFIYKEGKYQIEGNLKLEYNTNEIDIRIVITEENIYLSLLGQTIQVNKTNIGTLIEEIIKSLEIELPKIEFKLTKEEAKEILESIQITEEQISADLSRLGLGKIQLQLTMDNCLEGKITSDWIEMKIGISKTEAKEIEIPEVTINEQGIKQIVEYVKELQKIIKNKYVTIEVLGVYGGIQISGEIYIDFRTEVKAEANLILEFEKEKIEINIKYLQNTIYISYKNIKIKASIEELQKFIGPYLSALKEMDITIERMINIIQGFNISSTEIELRLNLEEILQGIGETIVRFSKTEVGFDVDMNLYDLHMSIDTTKEKDIEVEDSEYSSIKGYSKVIEYIISLVNKESIRMDIEGTYDYNQIRIEVIGSIDFVLNTVTKQYDIISYLSIVGNGMTIHFEIRVVNQKIFITLYDNIICLNINEFSSFINEVLLKFDVQPSLPDLKDNAVSQIISILNLLSNKENGIEVDLSTLVSSMSMLVIEYALNEDGLFIGAAVENLKLNISMGKSNVTMVEEQTPTLEKEDLLSIIEQVAYIVQLYQTGAVHIELGSSLIEVQLKDKKETILLAGNVDILFDTNSFMMQGNLVVDGFGVNSDVQFILSKDKIYITISNQTIVLVWNEIDQLINDALEILNPILNQNTLSIPEFNIGEFDFGDLNLILNSNSLQISLESLFGKLCNIGLFYHLTQTEDNVIKGLEVVVNGNYDNISLHMPVTITNSFVETIHIPTVNLLTHQDLIEILKYAVELYHVAMQKEFNLEINTSLSKNGEQIAFIEGMLSIRILDNNEFDARLKAIIREYKLGEAVAWHQLDVNVISLTTMNLLDSSIGHAMMYATYGNNESDQNAVIKISSTYTGIMDLIESIINLMNINVPALTDLEKTNVNLSNILEYLHVSKTSLSVGVNLKDLYKAMQDENQILHFEMNRNLDGKLTSINASNIYLSYTNENQFMTLDQISIDFKDTGLNVEIPSNKESYYDLSHISNLFEALYNNALEKNFEITGTVTLTAMSIININVPITIKVNVDDKGSPIVYAHLDMGNLGLGSMMMSKKQIYIYYKDEYVYIHRDDSKDKDDRKLKIHYSEFFNNLVYYLMDYAMGLPESIISLINKTPEGDGFIDASQCVNNASIGTDLFEFNLNLKEIADNNDLGNLEVSLASTLVAKTDEFGNYVYDESGNLVYVPMIYNIPKFKFVCVNVINLNSSSLTLSNIQKDELGNLVVKDVSMSELDQFVSEFDQQFNADEEYIYSNGQWISNGKLKHNVVFDMGLSGSKIRKYAEGEKIDFPYLAGEILSIETEKGLKYYKVMDWYYDSSYLKPVQNINSMYMSNKSLVYYAKVKDITINVQINSSFDEVYELVTYEGYDFTSDIEEIYNIKNVNNSIYKFSGLKDETDSFVDVNSLKAGSYQFFVDWEEIHYDFYVVYGNQEYKLDQTDTSLFLDQDYAIEKNSRYYLYHADKLTPKYILESFANSFILCEDKQRLELPIFALNDEMFAKYEKFTFEIAREEFNNKGYYGFFVDKQEELDLTTLLPNGVYESFEINAWISDSGKYYSLDELKSMNEEYQFTAYIATKQSCFEFETVESGARISLYSGTSSTLIFPEYAYVGSAWVSVIAIKELSETSTSPFTANTTIQDLIFNESLAYIPSNAFKNCDGLVNVYFPNALQAEQVSKDAFYFVKEGSMNFEKARDLAKKIRFHCSEILAEQLDLLACKYNNSDRHYGKNEAGFLGTGRADLRESFVKENVNILEVSNQFIKNL